MNLEQRVQMLEQEVQLLKNQIQTTLLAIQEHVLTNTYPSLRAEEASVPTPDYPSSNGSTQPKPLEGLRGVNRISFDGSAEPEVPVAVVAPAKPISTPVAAPSVTPPIATQPSRQKSQTTAIDWASLNKMDEWVSQKIDKMGISRTRKMIELYAERGRFNESVKNTLLQLVALYEEEADATQTNDSIDDDYIPAIDDTLTTFDPPIRAYYAEAEAPSNGQGRDVEVHRTTSANSNGHHKETGEMPQKMILRLIAGLQNAGMDWKKPNG